MSRISIRQKIMGDSGFRWSMTSVLGLLKDSVACPPEARLTIQKAIEDLSQEGEGKLDNIHTYQETFRRLAWQHGLNKTETGRLCGALMMLMDCLDVLDCLDYRRRKTG